MGKYFTVGELSRSAVAIRQCIDNTPSKEIEANLRMLIENLLDPVREKWGRPLVVNSGYRCRALNTAVGGSSESQHMKGMAADISAGSRAENRSLFDMIAYGGFEFDQLIDEKGYAWIHLSYSNGNNRQMTLHL